MKMHKAKCYQSFKKKFNKMNPSFSRINKDNRFRASYWATIRTVSAESADRPPWRWPLQNSDKKKT